MELTKEQIDDFIVTEEKRLLAKEGNPAAQRATLKELHARLLEMTKQESHPVVPTPPPCPPPGSWRSPPFHHR